MCGFWGLCALVLLSSNLLGKTVMDIETGFDGRFRPGRWSPVFVTVKSDQPRTAFLELHVPNASSSTISIRQAIGVGTTTQTYVLYAPLSMVYDPLRATLTDAETGKQLSHWPPPEMADTDRGSQQIGFMIVTAGRSPLLQSFRRASSQGSTIVSHQRYNRLPTSPAGYDSADIVYLNNPEWALLSIDQQKALIAWAMAGGTIIFYPGADIVPPDAPLAEILPCQIGNSSLYVLSDEQLKALGLSERFKSIALREIAPRKSGKKCPLPNGLPEGVIAPIGLGQIAVVPIDIGTLQFNDGDILQKFAGTFFDTILQPAANKSENYNYYDEDITAAHAALERIGSIPNTGGFGFAYIAIVVGGLMLIIGPIDWFVLKKLGKQPWTWATTVGWIGLFTCGALYAGHLLRDGELHLRSIRLIDQAGDQVVASDDIVLIYAPRSAMYQITSAPTAWWQPVPNGERYSSGVLSTPLRTEQSYRGNVPDAMWIDVWNWRFLKGTQYSTQPPIILSKLTFDESKRRLTGSITNMSKSRLSDIRVVALNSEEVVPGEIAPGVTHSVNITFSAPVAHAEEPNVYNRYGMINTSYQTMFKLSPAREDAVTRQMQQGELVLYGQIQSPESDIAVTTPGARVEHQAIFRAVVHPEMIKTP